MADPAPTPAPDPVVVAPPDQLTVLTALLIAKGIITADELQGASTNVGAGLPIDPAPPENDPRTAAGLKDHAELVAFALASELAKQDAIDAKVGDAIDAKAAVVNSDASADLSTGGTP